MGDPKNTSSKVRDEDVVIYKIMAAMVVTAVVICVLIVLYNKYQVMSHFMAIYGAVYYLAIGSGIGAAVFLAAALAAHKKPKPRKVLSIIGVCLLVLAICSVVMRIYTWEGIVWLFIAFPSALVLYILYLIYQRDFFSIALESVVSGIGFFVLYQMQQTILRPWTAAILAVFLAAFTILAALCGKDGQIGIQKTRLRLFQEPGSKVLLLITSVLCIVGWLLTVLLGGMAALVSAGVVLLWLIVMAVYFTIKLV